MSKVYFIDKSSPGTIGGVFRKIAAADFGGKDVLVKLHMGERGNRWYVKPETVRIVTDELRGVGSRPIIYDTAIVYGGQRNTREKYRALATEHGFDAIGCDVVIGDRGLSVDLTEGGIAFRFEVAEEVFRTGHIVSVVHGKGHGLTGFGGTIKNIGMGGVSKACKLAMHAATVAGKLKSLGRSPVSFNKILAMGAKACLSGKSLVCFHVLLDITKSCDCAKNALPIICPDLGYLLSRDPVASDAASIDMIIQAAGPSVFRRDPWEQVAFAEKIGLGSRAYELVRV
jgi:uncharacterized Fe-S center protein